MLQVRCEDEWLARVGAAADEMGLSVSAYVRAAVNAAMEGRLWQTVGRGEVVLASVQLPVKGGPTVSIPQPKAHRRPADTVMAAASVVAPRVRPSPRLAGSDPRDGCTHPPASVRTRGGIRSCGNCGQVLGAAKP